MVCQWSVLHLLQGWWSWVQYQHLQCKTCAQNIGNEDQQNDLHFFEELKNIENRVAWFLAELRKAEKGMQKDKRNQRRTELVRGVFSASR
jgi:hypothetical protein